MKKTSTLIIIAVVVVAISFFGGFQYGKSKAYTVPNMARFNNGSGNTKGMRNGGNEGFVVGKIISKDSASLTIEVQNGGSKMVFITSSTPIQKTISGVMDDLNIGEQVSVTGVTNSDGSITAQSIQIRPATTTKIQ